MLFIHNTVSLCNHCYRHIPAVVYEEDGEIRMAKNCHEHGIMYSVVETDPEFYYSLEHHRDISSFNQVLFEASDRCQLNCPHCYHLPDNKVQDRPIEDVIEQLSKFPRDSAPMLAGAEATLRPDFIELCQEINKLGFEKFELLSNGLRFASADWSKSVYDAGLTTMCLGLNHPSYQGEKVHEKQLTALQTMIDQGYMIGYVGYTIESYDHLPFILAEIQKLHHPQINHYRIRCGSFIGRSSDQQRSYLSELVKRIKKLTNDEIFAYSSDDNPYHVMVSWNGILLRLIQWPDVTNIDMEELATGPWCQFYDGPITNFVHQVITRDAYKNMNLPQLDLAPSKYHYRTMSVTHPHWKDCWSEPVPFTEFDWKLDADQQPLKNKLIIPINHVH
jgi:uncharacterized radical SAM superfamily Fe-S cluster-containing enzyme